MCVDDCIRVDGARPGTGHVCGRIVISHSMVRVAKEGILCGLSHAPIMVARAARMIDNLKFATTPDQFMIAAENV